MLVALVGVACVAVVTLTYAAIRAPEQDVVIATGKAFTKPMSFSHTKHKEYACTECHHDYKHGKNVWQEGQEVKLCNDCHLQERRPEIRDLEMAYHNKCMDCHRKMKKATKKTGPTSCSKCHLGAADDSKKNVQ